MTQCQHCGGDAQLFLCGKCTDTLRDTLREMPWWLRRLTETETGQARLSTNGGRKSTRGRDLDGDAELAHMLGELPERMHLDQARHDRRQRALASALAAGGCNARAAELLATIADSLAFWCRVICETRGLTYVPGVIRNRPSAYGQNHAEWLWVHHRSIACDENAADIMRDVIAFRREAETVVNRGVRWQALGKCPGVIRLEGPSMDGKTHPTADCGRELRAHDEQTDVRCPDCRTVHSVARLQWGRMCDAEAAPLPWADLCRVNKNQPDEYRVPPRTLRMWRQNCDLMPAAIDDDGNPLYRWADVQRVKSEKRRGPKLKKLVSA